MSRPDAIGAVALAAALCWASAFAQEERLISGPGSTLTENKCKICHELQHIRRARLSPGEWADNLRNMKERGTPMTDEEMRAILEYLAVYYNRAGQRSRGSDGGRGDPADAEQAGRSADPL